MDIELFKSCCECVTGCIIGIIGFSTFMYIFAYVIRKCCLDDCFMEKKDRD